VPKHTAVDLYRGCGGIKFCAIYASALYGGNWPLHFYGNITQYPLFSRLDGPQSAWIWWKGEKILLLMGTKLSLSSPEPVTLLTKLISLDFNYEL
jgi:hypothetical protein